MINIKDEAVRTHHHIVANNRITRDMTVNAYAGIITKFNISTRAEPRSSFYVYMVTTFFKYPFA